MRCFSIILFAVTLAGCQGNPSDAPETNDSITQSTAETDNAPAETTDTYSVSQSQSVQEKLTAMDAMVVPNANGGIKSVIFEGMTASQDAIDLIVASPELEVLSLSGTSVGNQEISQFGKLRNLRVLLIGGTNVTDEGLVHVQSLTNLERLGLGDTQVTDAGLNHLKELKNLKMLFLGETGVTEQGVAAFREAVPGCKIER